MPTWICNIPGADPATVAWHATLHLGLAAIVLGAGAIFLLLAVRAYRQPDQALTQKRVIRRSAASAEPPDRDPSVVRSYRALLVRWGEAKPTHDVGA